MVRLDLIGRERAEAPQHGSQSWCGNRRSTSRMAPCVRNEFVYVRRSFQERHQTESQPGL